MKSNPIKSGYGKATVSANIAELMRSGRKQNQAVAIAIHSARQAYRKRYPRGPFPHWLKEMVKNPDFVQRGGVHIDIGSDNKGRTKVNPRRKPQSVIAWTGGSAPPAKLPKAAASLAKDLYAEQIKEFTEYWGDRPDKQTRDTFKNRAIHDAWATYRHAPKKNPHKKTAKRKTHRVAVVGAKRNAVPAVSLAQAKALAQKIADLTGKTVKLKTL